MKGLSAKQKLIAASLTLVIGLVMTVGATLAWYSISTNPEVSGMTFTISGPETLKLASSISGTDPQYLDYHETLNLTDKFSAYMNLVPVSTADLVNWFIPTYDEVGNLHAASEFILDSTLYYANVGRYDKRDGELQYLSDGEYYTEAELHEVYSTAVNSEAIISSAMQNPKEISMVDQILRNVKGYYLYADLWMTTDNQYGSIVHLSYPHYGVEGATENNDMSGAFGTFVLPKLGLGRDDSDNLIAKSLSNNSETSVRIGFQIYADEENPDTVTDWYIFEPNADKHSSYDVKPSGDNAYIVGFNKTDVSISDGMYVETNPIGKVQTGIALGGVPVYTNQPTTIAAGHHLVQLASAWDTGTKTVDALNLNKKLNSTYLSFFGPILNGTGLQTLVNSSANGTVKLPQSLSAFSAYTDEEADDTSVIESSNMSEALFTIEYGHYVRIRMFVWVEGQDADCWNDVASGLFMVNLEFSEDDLHPEGDTEYSAG